MQTTKENNLKALKGRVIVQMLEQDTMSGTLHLPQQQYVPAGALARAKVLSVGSDIHDIKEGDIVHVKFDFGARIPMSSVRIYLFEDILLIENKN